jgi:hypothetical protein
MRLQDILFTGMDIPSEAQKIMDKLTSIKGMTEDEERAYKFGVSEAFRAVRTILNLDGDHIVFHLEGHDCMEEFDLDDLIEIVEEKEGY